MKFPETKLKKAALGITASIIIAGLVVILFISPFTKYLIERYDVKYTGRQIKIGWAYVNPFTGYVYLSHLTIYESKSDSVFFSAKGVSASFALRKLLSKTIEITALTLYQPKGIIIQDKKDFNFNDLIRKFTPERPGSKPSSIHFNILGIKIKNGMFYYRETITPINYFIKDVNLESTGKHWDADTIAVKFSFLSENGKGSAEGNFAINFKTLDYRLAAIVHKYNLKLIEQYLKALINYGHFSANLDADIVAAGNFRDQENIHARGIMILNDFHFGKNPEDDYASFDKLVLNIIEMNPKGHQYIFDSVSLSHPFFKYERYDYLDNLQTMFGKNGSNISVAEANPVRFNLILKIADYIKVLAKNFFQSNYKINRLAIYNGDFKFNDYALTEKFSIQANPLNLFADSINKNHKRVEISLTSGIKPYGNITVNLSINPKDSGDFDLKYHLQRLPATLFNPYLITYTSFPLDRGTIEFNGIWNVRNRVIKSINHLLVIDPRLTARLKNQDTKWIPAPLIMLFIRERGNVIDFEIPITGNLKNPKFNLWNVVFNVLENIVVKPVSTPYIIHVKNVENEIEKSLTLKWDMRQGSLRPNQEKFVNKMADFLVHDQKASIAVYSMPYADKEMEYILFFEAKKKYFLLSKGKHVLVLSKDDSIKVDKMSVKDSLFVHYLNKQICDTMLFTIQEKCNDFIGTAIVNAKFGQLNQEREAAFMLLFKNKAVENRIKFYAGEDIIPYNGYSYYKIVYKGELPKSLIKAYLQMNDINDEAPRKKFEKEREKNRSNL